MSVVTAKAHMNDFVFAAMIAGTLLMATFLPSMALAHYLGSAHEDTAPVWVCEVMGNGVCGADEPMVRVGR